MYLPTGTHTVKFTGGKPRKFAAYLNGELWHFRNLDGKTGEVKFNTLWPGHFTSPNNFEIESKPLDIKGENIDLPTPERNNWRGVKIVYVPNLEHTPARIYRNANPAIIQVGARFYRYPAQVRAFIILHELGHFYYHEEDKADLWALKQFLKLGLNASQAYYALSKVLHPSPMAWERMKKLLKELKKQGYVKEN